MYLLSTLNLTLHEFSKPNLPDYVILSHRWGEGEVLYRDVLDGIAERKQGYAKVKGCCQLALSQGWEYVWIDTCCIDKSSSAELSEAINSMFRWYQNAEVCYAYLSDVPMLPYEERMPAFRKSQWFMRGWTLQELLAPRSVVFYDVSWQEIGTRRSLDHTIASVTNIHCGFQNYKRASVAQKMSWAALRKTSRPEDMAYCLMGLFGVHMAVIYGEGYDAFLRLQLEIIKMSDDETIFAWTQPKPLENFIVISNRGLLAPTPAAFKESEDIVQGNLKGVRPSYAMTSRGLRLERVSVLYSGKSSLLTVWNCVQSHSQNLHLTTDLTKIESGGYIYNPGSVMTYLDDSEVAKLQTWNEAIFVRQPHYDQLTFHEYLKRGSYDCFHIDISSIYQLGFHDLPIAPSVERLRPTQAVSPDGFSHALRLDLRESFGMSCRVIVLAYYDPVSGDIFALLLENLSSLEMQVDINIVLVSGDKFLAADKFGSFFSESFREFLSTYKSFDYRGFDRISRILPSGRCVSATLEAGIKAGEKCNIVHVIIQPPDHVPWLEDESERCVITDDIYTEYLKTGESALQTTGQPSRKRLFQGV